MNKNKSVAMVHNILWSSYKGEVFSKLYEISSIDYNGPEINFFQIAETDDDRASLRGVELSHHRYPYKLIISGGYRSVNALYRSWQVLKAVSVTKSDAVVIPGYYEIEFWFLLFYCKFTRRPAAVYCDSTFHDKPKSNWFKRLAKRYFLSQMQIVFTYGERSAAYAVNSGAKPDAIVQRCQAAALPEHYSPERGLLLRSPSLTPRYLYVGRLAIEKNIDAMLYAFKKVHTELNDAELIIVGTGTEEPRLRAMVEHLNLSASVKFSGALKGNDLYTQYSNATCLVLPSKSEPWGLVVNESLHYGCPVIVSQHCGCVPELVIDGETGYTFNPDDPAELVKRMFEILDWSNSKSTALRCISQMEIYRPEQAAQSIYAGIKWLLKMEERDKSITDMVLDRNHSDRSKRL